MGELLKMLPIIEIENSVSLSKIGFYPLSKIILLLTPSDINVYVPRMKGSEINVLCVNFFSPRFISIYIEGKIKSATERNFFGIYYHGFNRHSHEQYIFGAEYQHQKRI